MRLTLAIVAAALCVVACKKNDSLVLNTNTLYFKSTFEQAGNIRVFAKTGEITTASIVNRFVASDSNQVSDVSAMAFGQSGDSITMKDNEHARILDAGKYANYTVATNDGDLIFTGDDTSALMIPGEVFSKSLPYFVSLYKPAIFSEYIISSTRGFYLFGYRTKKQLVLTKKNQKFTAPWIVLILHRGNIISGLFTVQNKPDFNFYTSIGATDTVVLREYSVFYDK